MSFQRCSGFTINGGSFTNANHVSNVRIVHNKVVMMAQEEREQRTIWDDYNHVKPGDVRIEENICTTSVRREYDDKYEEGRKQYFLWRDVNARRTLGIARLRGEDKDKFLYITYDGPDAFKAFQQDFAQFAHVKNVNVAQIFGYNDNERGLPALVFYDALIPLGRIMTDRDWLSPLLFSYFGTQFARMQRELSVDPLPIGELWVDPRAGTLQRGPYVELPFFESWLMLGTSENTMSNTHSTYLPIQTYGDNNIVLEYLTRTFAARTILKGISWSYQAFFEDLGNEQVVPVLSYLPGTIYNRYSREAIARFPGAAERWCYAFWRVMGRIPDAMRESRVVMHDGSMRFTVTSTEIQDLPGIELWYALYPLEESDILLESWLAQAHSVFSQLGIHEDDWKDYGLLGGFVLRLGRTLPPNEPNIPHQVYLFIRPVPRPSDDEGIWRSWAESENYFWSFDPFGQETVSERTRACSGLPTFASMITTYHRTWSPSHYDATQKLRLSKGFTPTTTEFVLSLCLPILKVIEDHHRFEEFEESKSSNRLRRIADKLKTRGMHFITKAKVGFGAKKSNIAVTHLEEATPSRGFTSRLEDVLHNRRER